MSLDAVNAGSAGRPAGIWAAMRRALEVEIAPGAIVAALTIFFGLAQLLLWRFLGAFPAPFFWLGAAALAALAAMAHQAVGACAARGPSLGRLLFCFAAGLALFLLGGEGRIFYSNIDWQVRDAVFRDISVNHWPFVYTARETPDVLRGAIGMYLLPALAYKAGGPAAGDIALLIQNSTLLALVLALGSTLFADARMRAIAFVVFIAFSGLDIAGQLLLHGRLAEHLEWWSVVQYSSHVTLAFWTPHYAIAGWLLAALFLLHQQGKAPLGVLLALALLTGLWSPLTLLGIAPFAALAGLAALARRQIRASDIAVAGLALLLCAPSFLYLGAAKDAVGLRFHSIEAPDFLIFQAFETLPYLVPLAALHATHRHGEATYSIIAAFLLAAPFIQIGYSIDFMMRAAIPAFAILAVMTADAVAAKEAPRPWRFALILALTIGSATGAFEAARAFAYPASPRGECSFFKAWDQSFAAYPKDSHLAPLDEMPALIRPKSPVRIEAREPEKCWEGDWPRPSGM